MNTPLTLTVNGRPRIFEALPSPATLEAVLTDLALRADRIAVELNGELAPRTGWSGQVIESGDKLEVVHFVGGGCPGLARDRRSVSSASHRSPY